MIKNESYLKEAYLKEKPIKIVSPCDREELLHMKSKCE